MLDLLIRHARLPDGRTDMAIAIENGSICEVVADAGLAALPAHQVLDANDQLVCPPFVDAHFHLDSALRHGQPRTNDSGTLLEGIALWGKLKPTLQFDAIVQTATRYCQWAVANGILAIRSHVDTSDPTLLGVQALKQVQKDVKPWLDLQLVAFPQDGLLRHPEGFGNLIRALDLGVEVIGGIPHFERSYEAGTESVKMLCELAAERGLMIDLHCDETDDPASRHVETLAHEVHRLGLEGRATASHLTSLHSMDNAYAQKLIGLIAQANLSVVSNPLINITLQGRYDTYPKRRGLTRVPELLKAGVTVAFGQDCVMDPWYSLGSGDLLEVAHMGLHVAQMTSLSGMHECFEAITTQPAKILHLPRYGLAAGCRADLLILQAQTPIDAIRLRANRLAVIRHGRCVSQTAPRTAHLKWDQQTLSIDWLNRPN
jgi:cytosine deaminase